MVTTLLHFLYKRFIFFYSGQVHRASFKGRDVVIKVQRPDLKDLFDIDLKNLRVCDILFHFCF